MNRPTKRNTKAIVYSGYWAKYFVSDGQNRERGNEQPMAEGFDSGKNIAPNEHWLYVVKKACTNLI
jgi:hypothetical protein